MKDNKNDFADLAEISDTFGSSLLMLDLGIAVSEKFKPFFSVFVKPKKQPKLPGKLSKVSK